MLPVKVLATTTVAFALMGATAPAARAGDLLITAAKPDRLYVIDAATRSVRSQFRIPDAGNGVATIVMSPNGRIAYALVDKMERIVGIDVHTGKTVFRAELSQSGERVKDFFGFTLTPDGRELIAYELPVLLKPSEYVVEEPRFAVFRTSAGLGAKPVRSFPAPRRVHMLLMRPSGQSFYAIGFDVYEYDVHSGKLLGTRGIIHWDLPGHSQPDLLAFWPVSEPTGVFTSPISSEAKTATGSEPRGGLMLLDLASGALRFQDFESVATVIFSSVLAPDRKFAYGAYTTLSKIDVEKGALAQRVDLDHTFYSINVATDGHELYLGGAMCDVAFYDPATLAKRALIKLPGCGDQALSSLRVVHER
jgi:quinohemoprotein amine dehydrogenase beta subunit